VGEGSPGRIEDGRVAPGGGLARRSTFRVGSGIPTCSPRFCEPPESPSPGARHDARLPAGAQPQWSRPARRAGGLAGRSAQGWSA